MGRVKLWIYSGSCAYLGAPSRFALSLFFTLAAACCLLPAVTHAQTELGSEDDLTILGTNGTALDPDTEIKGFTVFGSTQIDYTGAVVGPGNVVVNGILAVSSGAYFVDSSTFTSASKIFINDGSTGQMLRRNAAGHLEWTDSAALGDNLGNHVATTTLNMASWNLVNVSSVNFRPNVFLTSATAVNYGGVYVSTNLYVAGKYYGDGSALSGISGDNLGNHIATTTLNMSGNSIVNVASATFSKNITVYSTVTILAPDTATSSLWVSTSASIPHLYVSVAGDVGIGTKIPGEKLEVNGTIKASRLGLGTSPIANHLFDVHAPNPIADQVFYSVGDVINAGKPLLYYTTDGTNSNIRERNDNALILETQAYRNTLVLKGGYVGLGIAAPVAALHIKDFGYREGITFQRRDTTVDRGFVYIGNGTNSIADEMYWDILNSKLNIRTGPSGTDLTLALYNGRVGAGTAAPGANLHISSTSASAAQDMLKITTGTANADVFVVKGNGTVGIGTTDPGARLDIVSTGTASNIYAQIWRDSGGVIKGSMSATGYLQAVKFIGDGSGLTNLTGAGDDMGNHIATTTLNMAGFGVVNVASITVSNFIRTSTLTVIAPDSAAASLWVSTSAVSPHLYVSGTGKIGIGTSNPSYPLQVANIGSDAGPINTAGEGNLSGLLAFDVFILGNSVTTRNVVFNTSAVGKDFLFTNWTGATNAELVRIKANGYVGIGTNAPGAKFDVVGNSGANDPLARFGTTGVSDSNSVYLRNGSGDFSFFISGAANNFMPGTSAGDGGIRVTAGKKLFIGDSGAARMVLDSAGRVGVGTPTPAMPLQVVSNTDVQPLNVTGSNTNAIGMGITNNVAGSKGWLYSVAGSAHADGVPNGSFIFRQTTNDINAVVISTAGYVGIGVINPGASLEVAGKIKITGGTPGSGKVLTSDASGLATWETSAGDNMGNHTATTTLNMAQFPLVNVSSIAMLGDGIRIATSVYAGASGIFISTGGAITTTGIGYGDAIGNARGIGAVDLQTARLSGEQVSSGIFATVSGGAYNISGGMGSTVSGGVMNDAHGGLSTVSGGQNNVATGSAATVPGGVFNTAKGHNSWAGGYYSSSTANGSFTWSDSQGVQNINSVADRTVFKNRGGFLVTGSTNPAMTGTLDRGVLITGNGLVGISTGVPYAALDVVSTGTASNIYAQIWRNGGGVVVASMTSEGKLFADGSGLTGVSGGSSGPSIEVSTINATATTPYGGVNITTNTFVNGSLLVQSYSSGDYSLRVSTSSTAGQYSIAVSSLGITNINSLVIENRTSDPVAPVTGQIWLRVD